MSRALLSLLLLPLLLAILSAGPAQAEDGPQVVIEWPNEGETVYAGPSSLLYSIPIKGYVAGPVVEEAVVQLELLQAEHVAGSYNAPLEDGRFEFLATINPHGSDGHFPSEHLTCSYDCHLPGIFALPAGPQTLRVSLLKDGRPLASAERHIVVDLGQPAKIPVEIRLADDPQTVVQGVRVLGSTRLYLWRSRHFLAENNEDGIAFLEVEALSEASTDYLLQIRPTVVDGVLYDGVDQATVHLPPGATSSEPVRLYVRGYRGSISGTVAVTPELAETPCRVQAVSLPDGNIFRAPVEADGRFVFANLPVDQYRVTLDPAWLEETKHTTIWQDVNLMASNEEVVRLPLVEDVKPGLEGQITNEKGEPLPFAWVELGNKGQVAAGQLDGRFQIEGTQEREPLIARAPGYYNRAHSVSAGSTDLGTLALTERPEMRRLPWGEGSLSLPPESLVEVDGRQLYLEQGWVWGRGSAPVPYEIVAGDLGIELLQADFALAFFPSGEAWLYLRDGQALITDRASGNRLTVGPGEMVNLHNDEGLKPVAYDPSVIDLLNGSGQPPAGDSWEPTLRARFRDGTARFGVGAAQIVTFVTYSFILLSLGIGPCLILYLAYRRRKEQKG